MDSHDRCITPIFTPMTNPSPLKPEAERLAILRQYRLLDTAPEKAIDEFTELAAHVCDVPVALISLVDEHRQWFKSRYGLELEETSREESFSAQALNREDVLIVPDATLDERFADNPHVTCEGGFRFYAGTPLITPDRAVIGSLCVLDRVPRQLDARQERFLEMLGRQVMTQLNLRKDRLDLREKALLGKQIVDCSADAIVAKSLEGEITNWNPGAERMFGFSAEEMLGSSILAIIPPDRHDEELGIVGNISGGGTVEHFETVRMTKSGELIDVSVSASPVKNLEGEIIGLSKVIRNITERKRTEARFHRLVDSNVQGVIFWNMDGSVTGANQMFLNMLGHTTEDLEKGSISWQKLTPPEFTHLDLRALDEIAERGYCEPFEKEFFRSDGSRLSVLIGGAVFEDDPEEGVSFVLDLTERKKLEQQFLRAQRMESIGTLAGGIAHDLNNILSPILMSIDLLKIRVKDEASQDILTIIGDSATRGGEMVKQVLSFASGVEGQRMDVQVRHLIEDIEKITTDTFLKNIEIRTTIPPDLWAVSGDPTQLHQVLMNLCVNARDAMPHGGQLTVSGSNVTLDAHYAALNLEAHPGPYVFIQIEDNGTGIPAPVIKQIFDPFFTTKPVGKGTGLGLSTSMAIIKSHGGFIQVYSEGGRGTKFKIYLPARTGPFTENDTQPETAMPRGHGELILVVDDEASVRHISEQTLGAFGYRVILASDGAEAVAIYAARQKEIAVVLTDMMMPVMDGPTTIQVLRKINPLARIIAASGLSANGHVASATKLGVKHFLPKPYTAQTLLVTLHETLTSPP